MANTFKFLFTTVIVFFFYLLLMAPYKVIASMCNFTAGTGMEGEALDDCLKEQRRLDQQARDQQAADVENAQKIYEIKLTYFYKLDDIEKKLDNANNSDSEYLQYKLHGIDCSQSMRIPSDPTILDSSVFLSLVVNKEKCIDYLLRYIKKPVVAPNQQPLKSSDQLCIDKFGQNYKAINDTICGCKDGYAKKNGNCVSYDEGCNISYSNTKFLKIDSDNSQICDCKTGYIWNEQRTGCVIAPVVPVKTNDQVCNDAYGINSSWDGTKNNAGGLNCGCKGGYQWNQEQTQCVKIENSITLKDNIVDKNLSVAVNEKSMIDNNLTNRLKGKILLQVESKGEAYYVNPKDGKKYYMANGDVAYNAMRSFGVGVTNKDLNKIKTNKIFAKKNSGKILLQVESKGEAYYIDFNGTAHYLKDGVAAYEIMRSLGLGIKNNDLNKIPEGML